MGKIYTAIDDTVRSFIQAQHMFFVASAPSGLEGHVNCSPKGLESFRILDDRTIAYADFIGSGVETIAHVRQNGRIVIMFCAFNGPPKIVRFHGQGRVIEASDSEFPGLLATFERQSEFSIRAIVRVNVTRISTSCGYGVPLYRYEGQRDQLTRWAERKGARGLEDYKLEKNSVSIDGLTGLGSVTKAVQRPR